MIDAQAVLKHLQMLQGMSAGTEGAGLAWVGEELAPLAVEPRQDAKGNTWLTLPGRNERAVVLGSSLAVAGEAGGLDSRLGVVVALETLKALGLRYGTELPCTVQVVIWAQGSEAQQALSSPGQGTAAYLELHVEPGTQLKTAGTPLGVVTGLGDGEQGAFHPRLTALCDEAIRELTGTSATLPAGPAGRALEVARSGVPTAMMYVQALEDTPAEARETRLHELQAAEAFGRWAEATMHLVAGDEVDLWAREQRVPHSGSV